MSRAAHGTTGVPAAPGSSRLARVGLWLGPLAALTVLLWPLPEFGPGAWEPDERRAAAVTALTAVWWLTEAIPIGAASLLPAALLPLFGVVQPDEVARAYMNDLILLFLGAFLLALGIERWNVHRRVALNIACRAGSRPRRLVLGFMLASAFLSMWLNNTATTLMMLPIGVAVVDAVSGEQDGEPGARRLETPFGIALLLGMAYASSVGGVATPVGTAPNQVFLGQVLDRFPERQEVSFAEWTIAFAPLVVLFVPIGALLLTRVLLRVPESGTAGAEVLERARAALGPWRRPELRMAGLFGLTAFLWVTKSDLELGGTTLRGWENLLGERTVSNSTVAIFFAIVAFVVPSGAPSGGPLLDWSVAKRLPWEVLLLLGGGFALALGFQASGLDARLGESFGPLLSDAPTWLAVLVIAAGVSFLTEITSNTATTQVLLPVLASAGLAAGVDPYLWMLPATLAASCAFMLPVATPPNAVVFSSGRVAIPTMARVGVWVNVTLVLLITLLFQLWSRPILGLG